MDRHEARFTAIESSIESLKKITGELQRTTAIQGEDITKIEKKMEGFDEVKMMLQAWMEKQGIPNLNMPNVSHPESESENHVEEVQDLQGKNVEQEDNFEEMGVKDTDSKIATAVIIEEFMVEEVQDLQWTNTCIKEVEVLRKKQEMGMENGSTSSQIFGETVGDNNCEDKVSKGSGNKTHSWARKMNKTCSRARKTSKTCFWERKMSYRISLFGCATQKFTKMLQLQELQTTVTKVQVLQFPLIPPPPPKPPDAS